MTAAVTDRRRAGGAVASVLLAAALLLAGLSAGCRQVPAHLEPAGHSTSYRTHAEAFDAEFVPWPLAEPVIVPSE